MATLNSISSEKLFRLIGTPASPAVIDVRSPDEAMARPALVPGAVWRDASAVADWSEQFRGRTAVIACSNGHHIGQGVAAWLRQAGASAEVLDGGVDGWAAAGLPLVPQGVLPPRNARGQTVWVTRARPKIDRIACPWLIRRFVDPDAVFLYVPTTQVTGVADQHGGAPFDIDGPGVRWSHDGERCTFDVMLDAFGLNGLAPLARIARIVRGADTGRLDLAPEAAGLLAVSLGLSRMFSDDIEQLDAGLAIYDALYRWSRDATDEVHNAASHKSVVQHVAR